MNTEEKASAALRLSNDEGFVLLNNEILEAATAVFRNASSTQEERELAHEDVRLIQKHRNQLRLWADDKVRADHKQKGQHRG